MTTAAYYNEIDPHAAQWLRNLIAAGHIPAGDVDTRSIEDVRPDDLRGYAQCHFFAGIGGWPLALALAGWPADRPVWTGSCPCQPFSAAGKGAGFADERHLWPAWQHLIAQCRPPVIFGEQVASKDAEPWIDLVHADLEGMGYAFGCVPFPAAGVGAPHIRDRTYWVAGADGVRLQPASVTGLHDAERDAEPCGGAGGLANADGWNASAERQQRGGEQRQQPQDGGAFGLADAHRGEQQGFAVLRGHERDGADAGRAEGFGGAAACSDVGDRPGPTNGPWGAADWLGCTDGKWRPVEPGTFPLANGVPGRVGRLRAYGNAIVPTQAVEWILAYAEARGLIAEPLEKAA